MSADEWDDENPTGMLDEDDGNWRDPDDDYREPDPEDADIAREYEEYAEHCETVHGGGECDCRPSLRERLAREAADAARRIGNARARLSIAMRGIYTVRLGRAELTLRLNADREREAARAAVIVRDEASAAGHDGDAGAGEEESGS